MSAFVRVSAGIVHVVAAAVGSAVCVLFGVLVIAMYDTRLDAGWPQAVVYVAFYGMVFVLLAALLHAAWSRGVALMVAASIVVVSLIVLVTSSFLVGGIV